MTGNILNPKVEEISLNATQGIDKQSAFVLLYCRDATPWSHDENPKTENWLKKFKCAAFFCGLRFDGSIGFPGGNIDPGEDPKTAAIRELWEECSVDIGGRGLSHGKSRSADFIRVDAEPEHICSHKFAIPGGKVMATHLFGVEVDYETLLKVQRQVLGRTASEQKERFAELRAPMIQTYEFWPNKIGMLTFLLNAMPLSVLEEIMLFTKKLKLTAPDNLAKMEGTAAWKNSLPPTPQFG